MFCSIFIIINELMKTSAGELFSYFVEKQTIGDKMMKLFVLVFGRRAYVGL